MDGFSLLIDEIDERDWNIPRLFCAALAESKALGKPFESAWQDLMLALRPPRDPHPELARQLAEDRELLRSIKPWLASAYTGVVLTADEIAEQHKAAERKVDDLQIDDAPGVFAEIAGTVPLAD